MSANLFARHTSAKCVKLRIFFPRASERRLLPIVGVCKTSSHHSCSSSHPHIFTSMEPRFVRKGCARRLGIPISPQFFWRSNLVSCERVAPDDLGNCHFTSVFGDRTVSCERVTRDDLEIAILPQFWRSNLISCESIARDGHSVSFGTASAPAENRRRRGQ